MSIWPHWYTMDTSGMTRTSWPVQVKRMSLWNYLKIRLKNIFTGQKKKPVSKNVNSTGPQKTGIIMI